MTYSLQALLTIREQNKKVADLELNHAIFAHRIEETKLLTIETQLKDAIFTRCERQNSFFYRAQMNPSTKTEVACHVASAQKKMRDELSLRKSLQEQKQAVLHAYSKVQIAKNAAIDAHRRLKVVEKHFASWQQRINRTEEIKKEYAADDQNNMQFLLKRA